MLSPVFVKGSLRITLDRQKFEFVGQNISQFGVTGLPWGELSATEHFSAKVGVEVEMSAADQTMTFSCRGHIIREYTATTEAMGVRFVLDAELSKKVGDFVRKNGYSPSEFLRKYPRIPSNSIIQTFPTHALVAATSEAAVTLTHDQSIVMEVINLSPNGALLATENQMALMMQPGERIIITLQPRGWFPTQIKIQSLICRVTDDVKPNGNLERQMGVKFMKMDELNRTAFLDLLKDILEQIKKFPPE
jgi:hypothetical protein